VSARQVEIADRLAAKEGLAHRCSFTLGDFHTTDLRLSADAIVAVESFVHSADPSAFLANADRHLLPGGRLIIVDDFLASERESMDARQRRRVEQFQAGWRVPGVCMAERLVSVAAEHGLEMEKTVDLTSLTRPGSRLRDRLTAALSPLLVGLGLSGNPFCGNLIGGHALQVGLREGLFRYRLLTFRKPV
jgi:SAM-dependent methyltransferase